MSRARLEPGELGRVSFERRGNSLRGLARARDGSGKLQPLRATGASEDEIRADLARQAAALVYAADEWNPRTTLSDAVERWLSTQGRSSGGNRPPKQQPQSVEAYARAARGLVIPRLGMLRLEQITAGRLNEFLERLRDEPQRGAGRGDPKIGYSDSYRKQALHVFEAVPESRRCVRRAGTQPRAQPCESSWVWFRFLWEDESCPVSSRRSSGSVRSGVRVIRRGTRTPHDEMIRYVDAFRDRFGVEAICRTPVRRSMGFSLPGDTGQPRSGRRRRGRFVTMFWALRSHASMRRTTASMGCGRCMR